MWYSCWLNTVAYHMLALVHSLPYFSLLPADLTVSVGLEEETCQEIVPTAHQNSLSQCEETLFPEALQFKRNSWVSYGKCTSYKPRPTCHNLCIRTKFTKTGAYRAYMLKALTSWALELRDWARLLITVFKKLVLGSGLI